MQVTAGRCCSSFGGCSNLAGAGAVSHASSHHTQGLNLTPLLVIPHRACTPRSGSHWFSAACADLLLARWCGIPPTAEGARFRRSGFWPRADGAADIAATGTDAVVAAIEHGYRVRTLGRVPCSGRSSSCPHPDARAGRHHLQRRRSSLCLVRAEALDRTQARRRCGNASARPYRGNAAGRRLPVALISAGDHPAIFLNGTAASTMA